MKMTLLALLLAVTAVAHADDSPYYLCSNLDASSKGPGNVLLAASAEGMMGMFNALNPLPPRALFNASPVSVGNPRELTFGAVAWETKHDGFADFQSATVDLDANGAITQAAFVTETGTLVFGNCKQDSDNP